MGVSQAQQLLVGSINQKVEELVGILLLPLRRLGQARLDTLCHRGLLACWANCSQAY